MKPSVLVLPSDGPDVLESIINEKKIAIAEKDTAVAQKVAAISQYDIVIAEKEAIIESLKQQLLEAGIKPCIPHFD